MDIHALQDHIHNLATLEESAAPLISCYLDVASGAARCPLVWHDRIQLLRKSLTGQARADFENAADRIERCVASELKARTSGVAIFAREGSSPFFLALQFRVPLPNWIAVGPTPNIYHLVEIKDNYDRYVILLATETSARILGVNIGAVTEHIWHSRPELRTRVEREWSKDHFQDHRRERNQQFLHEQIRVLERPLASGGYGHLILAGSPRLTSAIRKALPRDISHKLVDTVPASARDHLSDIVDSTLQAFLEYEERESQAIAESLAQQIHRHGPAVAGTSATFRAVKRRQAGSIVIAKAYEPGLGLECKCCGYTSLDRWCARVCPACRRNSLRDFDIKAEIVRIAEASECHVEMVEHSDVLMELGGVGCLLRYMTHETYAPAA